MSAQAKGCAELNTACVAAGFTANGTATKGSRIVRDCISPLINGISPPGNGILPLPNVSQNAVAACRATKTKGGKAAAPDAAVAGQTAGAAPAKVKALPAGAAAGPNIVFILADDFSFDLINEQNGALAQAMPNLARMMQQGLSFSNYFVTDSLCCPSRTSIFTGLLPHNSGVITNTGADGGYGAFMSHNNDSKTFALALHGASYATAMMGKYLNGYEVNLGVPQGWSDWAVAANGYGNFNYSLNQNGSVITPKPHLTDEISQLGQDFIAAATGPFFLELATFSPHAPYTPPARYADAFPGLTYPQSPAYGARPDDAAPQWMKDIPPLDARFAAKVNNIYRLRVQSVKGIDDMIGAIRKTLEAQGLTKTTYVIFSSDNGYHMGEHSFRPGKMTPFDTDINVPLVVVGPGVPAGKTVSDMAMNIDLLPTFLDLAGLPVAASVDGQSLAGLLRGGAGPNRSIAVVEHKQSASSANDPDATDSKAGDPPTYVALRMKDALYVEYLGGSGEVAYYDLKADPDALHNIAATLPAARLKALHDALQANHTCAGTRQCAAAQALKP